MTSAPSTPALSPRLVGRLVAVAIVALLCTGEAVADDVVVDVPPAPQGTATPSPNGGAGNAVAEDEDPGVMVVESEPVVSMSVEARAPQVARAGENARSRTATRVAGADRTGGIDALFVRAEIVAALASTVRVTWQREASVAATTVAAAPRAASPVRVGDLPSGLVEGEAKVFHANKGQVARCMKQARRRHGEQRGRLMLRIGVDAEGRVLGVETVENEASDALAVCLSALVEGWSFGPQAKAQRFDKLWVMD